MTTVIVIMMFEVNEKILCLCARCVVDARFDIRWIKRKLILVNPYGSDYTFD